MFVRVQNREDLCREFFPLYGIYPDSMLTCRMYNKLLELANYYSEVTKLIIVIILSVIYIILLYSNNQIHA